VPFFERDRSDWPRGTARVLKQDGDELDVEVSIDGEAPYEATTKYEAPGGASLVGQTLNVRVHPKHRDDVHVESLFDALSDPAVAQTGAPAAALQQLLGAFGGNVQVVDGGTQVIDASNVPGLREEILAALKQHGIQIPEGTEAHPDAVGQLEKLAQLHTSGALTDAEFEAAKKKLLGQ
jgi:hypothetical protein